jgi:hypothetical protein
MAVSSIAVPPDARRDARARELVASVVTWPRHTLKVACGSFEAGTTFRRATGSNGARYLVNAVACECPDYQQAGHICKHVRAVVLFEAASATPAPARKSYVDLFPACAAGCGELVERKGERCYRCLSAETRRLERESQRQAVVDGRRLPFPLNLPE